VREHAGLPLVGDVRGIGMVAALELVSDKETKEPLPGTAPVLREIRLEGMRRGLFLRPLGNVVYLFLPQAVTREALDDILDRFSDVLKSVLKR
jgi:adenosylmethionine-8-amino-7-oxononanoate aminotransferase